MNAVGSEANAHYKSNMKELRLNETHVCEVRAEDNSVLASAAETKDGQASPSLCSSMLSLIFITNGQSVKGQHSYV